MFRLLDKDRQLSSRIQKVSLTIKLAAYQASGGAEH
jgi:hypothetical protein